MTRTHLPSPAASRLASVLGLALALALAAPAARAGMRCDGELVQEGDTKAELLLACGEPLLQEVVGIEEEGDDERLVEHWTYERGPGKFLKLVVIEGGVIASFENVERQ